MDEQIVELAAQPSVAGEAAMTVHHGPYDMLGQAYERLEAWIREQGREPGAGPWESYRDNPMEVGDPARLRTDLYWPVT